VISEIKDKALIPVEQNALQQLWHGPKYELDQHMVAKILSRRQIKAAHMDIFNTARKSPAMKDLTDDEILDRMLAAKAQGKL
jgi:hypothetical protein